MPKQPKKDAKLEAEGNVAKSLKAIHENLEYIEGYELFSPDFRNWIKYQVERIEWKHPDLLK